MTDSNQSTRITVCIRDANYCVIEKIEYTGRTAPYQVALHVIRRYFRVSERLKLLFEDLSEV